NRHGGTDLSGSGHAEDGKYRCITDVLYKFKMDRRQTVMQPDQYQRQECCCQDGSCEYAADFKHPVDGYDDPLGQYCPERWQADYCEEPDDEYRECGRHDQIE